MIFDLLISAAIAVGLIKDCATDKRVNDYFKESAKTDGLPFYIDNKGNTYSMETGKKVLIKYSNGHNLMTDLNGRVIRDLTQEKLDKQEEEAKKEAVKTGKRFYRAHGIRGDYYKEVSTGKVYKRTIGNRGDRFHNPDIYYVEVVIKNGKEDYSARKEFRSVYEFGEGPTDQEKSERERLFQEYSEDVKEYKKFCRSHDLSVLENHEESMRLFRQYKKRENDLIEYDRAIKHKYFVREEY